MSALFANLLLAHFLSDFPLQWDRMVADKRQKLLRGFGLYVHGLIVAGISWLAIGYWCYWWLAVSVAVCHFLIDYGKVKFTANGPVSFVTDQALHVISLGALSKFFLVSHAWLQWACIPPDWALLAPSLACAYLFCLSPANYFVREIIAYCKVKDNINRKGDAVCPEDVRRSGMLIGSLERILILSFVLMGSLEAAGLTIAAKSLLRFNDDDGPRTEYVLAGTLLSLLIALACAAALYCFVLDVDVIGIIKAGVANARS